MGTQAKADEPSQADKATSRWPAKFGALILSAWAKKRFWVLCFIAFLVGIAVYREVMPRPGSDLLGFFADYLGVAGMALVLWQLWEIADRQEKIDEAIQQAQLDYWRRLAEHDATTALRYSDRACESLRMNEILGFKACVEVLQEHLISLVESDIVVDQRDINTMQQTIEDIRNIRNHIDEQSGIPHPQLDGSQKNLVIESIHASDELLKRITRDSRLGKQL